MYISVTCLAFRGAAREVHQLNFWDVLQSGTRLDYCHQAKGRLGFRLEACRTSQNHCTQRWKWRKVGPPAQASPPNLAVSGLQRSYLNYVSERPSCLCCEADITSQLSAVFFSPQYPTFSAALSKLCWISNSSLFIFQGTQVQAGASTSAVSGLLSFLRNVSERPSCFCCEANITSQLSAIFSGPFFSWITNLLRSTIKIALHLNANSSLFVFQGPQVQAGAPTSAVSGLM